MKNFIIKILLAICIFPSSCITIIKQQDAAVGYSTKQLEAVKGLAEFAVAYALFNH